MRSLIVVCLSVWGAAVTAKPAFFLPDRISAAVGTECNVYFNPIFDSVRPEQYVFDVLCPVGTHMESGWHWTPKPEDMGKSHALVIQAWTDDGLVAAVTTRVHVADLPTDEMKKRKLTLSLLADSGSNCRYQDRLLTNMRKAGFSNYTPIGLRPFDYENDRGENTARHDGYGGYQFGTFLTQYALTVDEIDNLQSEAEREQLEKLAVNLADSPNWRRPLLKSPLVRIVKGEKRVDARYWLDRINGGCPPDVIVIQLGVNGPVLHHGDELRKNIEEVQIPNARRLVAVLREVAPNAIIGLCLNTVGCGQDGYGKNYGTLISQFRCRRAIFAINRAIAEFVRRTNDPKMFVVPLAQAVDPVYAYIREGVKVSAVSEEEEVRFANALHLTREGGCQMGDALYAWLLGAIR